MKLADDTVQPKASSTPAKVQDDEHVVKGDQVVAIKGRVAKETSEVVGTAIGRDPNPEDHAAVVRTDVVVG